MITKESALRLLKDLNLSLEYELDEEYFLNVLNNYVRVQE